MKRESGLQRRKGRKGSGSRKSERQRRAGKEGKGGGYDIVGGRPPHRQLDSMQTLKRIDGEQQIE